MKVSELIVSLSHMPQDSEVVVEAEHDFCPVKTLLPLQPSCRVLLVPGEAEDEGECHE